MSIGAGELDRRVTLQRATTASNALNEPVETWGDLATVWARRRDVSDGEKFAAGQVGSSLQARFVIRSSTLTRTVTPVDRLSHGGRIWNIVGVKEADEGRQSFIEITAVTDSD